MAHLFVISCDKPGCDARSERPASIDRIPDQRWQAVVTYEKIEGETREKHYSLCPKHRIEI